MRTFTLNLAVLLIAPCFIYAQNTGKVSGKIIDGNNGHVLEGATVSALNEETGIFIKHSVSGKKGEFTISGLPLDTRLAIVVSFTGYSDSSVVVKIPR